MKKYMGYLPLLLLCLIVLFSQLVYGRRNDFSVELSTLSEQENKSVGDPEVIADLKYSFYIGDSNSYNTSVDSGNIWRVDAVGDSFKLTYEPHWYQNMQYQEAAAIVDNVIMAGIEKVYDAKTMPMSEIEKNCEGYDQDGAQYCTYAANLDHLSYTVTIGRYSQYNGYAYKKETREKEFNKTFTVKTKNGKKEIPVTYNKNTNNDEIYIYTSFSYGNADDKYGNLRNNGSYATPSVTIGEEGFTFIGALQFDVNFNVVEFEEDPTGIYRIDKDGNVTQVIAMDVKKETILAMEAFKENLVTIVEKNGKLYGRLYSTAGKLLDEFQFKEDLSQTGQIGIIQEKEQVIFVQEPIYDSQNREVTIYDVQDDEFTRMDQLILPIANLTTNVMFNDIILHYDQDKKMLYAISNEQSSLIVMALNNKKILYSSRLFGDYGDDEKLALPQAGELIGSNAYENAVSHLLNTQKRTIYDIHLQQDGDDT